MKPYCIDRLPHRSVALTCLAIFVSTFAWADERPNVLWITSEDNSCYLGCYGDPNAETPHLDRLAAEGIRYRNAFANAPVCSTARSTLITGMHACSLGIDHHRSRVAIPEAFLLYPELLRAAGYYCTNHSKEDYNIQGRHRVWDESSRQAHYRHRKHGQPFFAVFNLTTTHESQVATKEGKSAYRIAPEELKLPAYHPDTHAIRRDWANYYDQMTLMDKQVGDLLRELEQSGEAENTIVFYYSDHGGALPGGKRSIQDVGTRVPMIIRFPERWRHLSPASPGQWIEHPVSFVDLPATLLSVCEVDIPDHYQGVVFLGKRAADPQSFVYLFRGRMDERYDTVRSIRTTTHRYVKNYSPHRPAGQHYTYAFSVQPSMRSWYQEFVGGRCDPVQSKYWLPKSGEELYQTASDPDELSDLIGSASEGVLDSLRQQLRARIISLRDAGFIPEGMFPVLSPMATIHEYVRSDAYPIERIVDMADKATSRDVKHLGDLVVGARDSHPVIRYWAATGFLILRQAALSAKPTVLGLLHDPSFDVQVVAAEAIAHLGEPDLAMGSLKIVLSEGTTYEILAAQNAVEYLWRDGLITLADARRLLDVDRKWDEPLNRIPRLIATAAAAAASDSR
jgi:N-sulfoglucosamine sulfohydrolase